MLRSRRVQRYQRFLKTLRRPDSKLCACPLHIHPRPWVPPPCRTSRACRVDGDQTTRRSSSNPDLMRGREVSGVDMEDDYQPSVKIQHMYNEARILKDALHTIQHGDQLSKDAYNTVKKWSEKRIPEAKDMLEKNKQRRLQRRQEDEPSRAPGDKTAAGKEEELRAELRTLCELSQSNEALLQVNKKLKRKVEKLQQRIKREEVAGKGSRESVAQLEASTRDDYIFLTLKKKYDDLLQYALKVESENQKLKSLGGMSGEQEGWYNDSERENAETPRGSVADLKSQVQELRAELLKKDEYVMKCEQHLQTLKNNMALRDQSPGQGERRQTADGLNVATLEQEWTRRLIETRETYDQAIQGYKDQLGHLRAKMEDAERNSSARVQELTELLAREQERQVQAERERKSKDNQESGEKERKSKKSQESVERERKRLNKEKQGSVEETRTCTGDVVPERGDVSEVDEGTDRHVRHQPESEESSDSRRYPAGGRERDSTRSMRRNVNGDGDIDAGSRERNSTRSMRRNINRDGNIDARTGLSMEGAYKEALDLIIQRLENLQVSRDSVETTIAVIKDTISQCLQEWRESFQQQQSQQNIQVDQLSTNNTELRRKLQERNKKVESLVRQCSELEQENTKLVHQCSLAESRVAAAQASGKLEGLQGLPLKLQELEQALIDTKELLHRAQAEKQGLQDQASQLAEKLAKKETKLRTEREQSAGRGDEVAGLRVAMASHQQHAEDAGKDVSLLREQLATKDVLLEQMSAQLEERIRECAHLASQIERYRLQQDQEVDRYQVRLQERESSSHKQYLDAQAQASRYQAQLSALRSEKEQSDKTLRCYNHKLEEQVDQLQLKNSTLERQLKTITSTFHSMFTNVDFSAPLSPRVLGATGL